MLVNSSLTVYHLTFDSKKRIEKWIRYNYENVWWSGGKGASTNEGYENANDVKIRIPYDQNEDLDISNFKIGDIVVKGSIYKDIESTQDLDINSIYNITSIINNNFGNSKHIHLEGK